MNSLADKTNTEKPGKSQKISKKDDKNIRTNSEKEGPSRHNN